MCIVKYGYVETTLISSHFLGPVLTYEYFINSRAPYITNESGQTGCGKPDKIVSVQRGFCIVPQRFIKQNANNTLIKRY